MSSESTREPILAQAMAPAAPLPRNSSGKSSQVFFGSIWEPQRRQSARPIQVRKNRSYALGCFLYTAVSDFVTATSRFPVGRLVVVLNDFLPDAVQIVGRVFSEHRDEDDSGVFRFIAGGPKEFKLFLTRLRGNVFALLPR
jgi:hypothetical protein